MYQSVSWPFQDILAQLLVLLLVVLVECTPKHLNGGHTNDNKHAPKIPRARAPTTFIETGRLAVLLVGRDFGGDQPNFDKHAHFLASVIVKPHEADVFCVTEYSELEKSPGNRAAKVLLALLGLRLKAVGLVSPSPSSGSVKAFQDSLEPNVTLRTEHVETMLEGYAYSTRGYEQWHKLHKAWKLMVDNERSTGQRYDIVLKLRFDCTPSQSFEPSISMRPEINFRALYAMSDYMFWGRRDVMEIAANHTWTLGINVFFAHDRPNPLVRPLSTAALLRTLLSVPHSHRRRRHRWTFYNKAGTLAYPDLGLERRSSYDDMIAHTEAAIRRGYEFIDPTLRSSPGLLKGTESAPVDWPLQRFLTERDMLAWMLYHNVTVCSFGANTVSFLYKGKPSKVDLLGVAPCRSA